MSTGRTILNAVDDFVKAETQYEKDQAAKDFERALGGFLDRYASQQAKKARAIDGRSPYEGRPLPQSNTGRGPYTPRGLRPKE